MSFAANQNQTNATSAPAQVIPVPPNNGNASGSLTQGGSGPTALVMLILYQVMALYSKITGDNAQEQKSEIAAQSKATTTEANQTKWAGHTLGMTMIIGGAAALAGTGMGYLAGTGRLGGAKDIQANIKASGDAETALMPLNKVSTLDSEAVAVHTAGETSPEVQERVSALKRGEFNFDDDNTTRSALSRLKSNQENPEEYTAVKDRLNAEMERHEKVRNTMASRNNDQSMKLNMYNSLVTQVGQSVNSGVQGYGQMEKANNDKIVANARTASSMAQQSAGAFATAQSKAADAQNAIMNVFSALRQASTTA